MERSWTVITWCISNCLCSWWSSASWHPTAAAEQRQCSVQHYRLLWDGTLPPAWHPDTAQLFLTWLFPPSWAELVQSQCSSDLVWASCLSPTPGSLPAGKFRVGAVAQGVVGARTLTVLTDLHHSSLLCPSGLLRHSAFGSSCELTGGFIPLQWNGETSMGQVAVWVMAPFLITSVCVLNGIQSNDDVVWKQWYCIYF